MARALINDDYLNDIADAIRAKTGDTSMMYPSEMAANIMSIPTGGGSYQSKIATPSTEQQIITPDLGYDALSMVTVDAVNLQSKNVVPGSSSQTVGPDIGYLGLSSVEVAAVPSPSLQSKTASSSTIAQTITPDFGYDGLSSVEIQAASLQTKNVTLESSAQQITADNGYYGLAQVNVPAAPTFNTQSKTVHPSTSQQTVVPDSGIDGLSSVIVEAMDLESRQVSPSSSAQVITPTTGKDAISQVTVNAINLQTKQVTPSGVAQIVTADQNYDGLLQVEVAAVPQNPEMDLLWSWTSSFNTDHTVSVDLSGYGGVLIYGEVNNNAGSNPIPSRYKCLTYVPVIHGDTTSRSIMYGAYVDSSSSIQGYRSVSVTDAGLSFGDGHSVTGRTDSVNDNYARPIRIYGVKETCPLFSE